MKARMRLMRSLRLVMYRQTSRKKASPSQTSSLSVRCRCICLVMSLLPPFIPHTETHTAHSGSRRQHQLDSYLCTQRLRYQWWGQTAWTGGGLARLAR